MASIDTIRNGTLQYHVVKLHTWLSFWVALEGKFLLSYFSDIQVRSAQHSRKTASDYFQRNKVR